MGYVQQKVVDPVLSVAERAATFVLDKVVTPVVNTVGNVVNAALSDPITTIATIAAVATGNAWAVPLIQGASVAAKGGSMEQVLTTAAVSYIAQGAGKYVGNAAGSAAQQTFGSQVAGKIIGQGAASATVAAITGGNPLQAFVTGGVSAAIPVALGKIEGYANLQASSPVTAGAISGAISSALTGGNVTAGIINGAIAGGQYVAKAVSGLNIDDQAKSVLADVMMSTVTAGVAGGDMSKAMQNALMRVGTKALGDIVTDKFQQVVTSVRDSYNAADKVAQQLDQNNRDQVRAVDQYNAVRDQYNNGVAVQKEFYDKYVAAKAKFDAAPSQATADAVNAAVKAYDNYSAMLATDTAAWQKQLDTYNGQLTQLQKDQALMTQNYEGLVQAFTNSSDQLSAQMQDVQQVTNKNLAIAYDPNFNADEYARINDLPAGTDAYQHFVETGQKQGLLTNDKDVAVQSEIAAYKAATGQDIPADVLANLGARSDRVEAVKTFTDVAIADKQVQDNNRKQAFEAVTRAYQSQGLTSAQIDAKYESGEATALANQITANQRAGVDYLQQEANKVIDQYGKDSQQYKDAARAVLDAKASIGGYGITKDSAGNYTTAQNGVLDPDTLVPVSRGGSWYDPVRGAFIIEVYGTGNSAPLYSRWGDIQVGNTTLGAIANGDVSAVLALGNSANPPSSGGKTVFGDGSGVSSGLFGGLQLIAQDSGTGAKMWDGGNGFSLITYSDGHSVAVKNDTQEVVWLDNTQTQDLRKQIDTANPPPPPIQKPPADPVKAVTDKIDQSILSAQEIKDMFANTGYTPSDTQIQSMVSDASSQLATTPTGVTTPTGSSTQTDIYGNATTWTPVNFDTTTGAVTSTTSTPIAPPTTGTTTTTGGTTTPTGTNDLTQKIIDQAAQNESAGLARDVALASAINSVAGTLNTTKADLLTKIGATEADLTNKLNTAVTSITSTQNAIIEQAAKNETAGMARDVALASAIDTVAGNLNTTKTDLLAKLGTTEATLRSEFASGIAGVKADLASTEKAILDQTAKNEAAGMARDVALANAIGTVSEQLGTTKTDLLIQIGTTEANLNGKLDVAKAELTGQITGVQKDLTGQITGVKNTIGSATQAGTQDDLNHLLGVLQNGGAYDAQYDFNGDGKLDTTDVTGLSGYIGTGSTGTGTAPSGGSKWGTPTGVFKTIADEAAATRAANAAAATKTQRMGNINTMMSMLTQAPDAGGQQVTVKAADPTKIGYVYDFNSIFANPTQQKMFVTPYAEGGSVGSIDEANDELLKILKG